MAERASHGSGQGASPGRDPGLPGGLAASGGALDDLLAGFAEGGTWNTCRPSAALAAALEAASGKEWRCPGASREEMFGLLRRWAAVESWAVAGKLGTLRALIRDEGEPQSGGGYRGDLPDGWTKSLTHEVALALALPPQSADKLMSTARSLQAVLPGIGALLADGTLTYAKARAVDDALAVLADADAAKAEALILPELAGKTYGQAEKLALQAAVTADPGSAARRREEAERNRARVTVRRDPSGAASLAGYDLPTDETLAAYSNVCVRADEYKVSGVFPGVRMDQFRAMAYLDILNGTAAEARIASGQPPAGLGAPNEYAADDDPACPDGAPGTTGPASGASPEDAEPDNADRDNAEPNGEEPEVEKPEGDDREPRGPDSGPGGHDPEPPGPDGGPSGKGPGGKGPGSDGPAGNGPGGTPPFSGGTPGETLQPPPRLADLVVPLGTLLGLAERPGEGHLLGPIDPDLCRALAAAAASSPHSRLCVTVTDSDGSAIGHGCARTGRHRKREASAQAEPGRPGHSPGLSSPVLSPPGRPPTAAPLPARLNLTITAARLMQLARTAAPPGHAPWAFTKNTEPGPPDGYGTWTLTMPNGGNLTVELRPVPTFDCDHRYESHAYQPNGILRHLVQIRDYQCTFPTCSRHAKDSDFEHAVPYDQGGRTCACNAGARSRACHQVKQSKGWTVTQPKPGWHQWQTPSGRRYTQGPKRYPV
jgi:hypothetical protein